MIRKLLLLLLTASCFAKTFPATRDSVPMENRYAESAGIPRFETAAEIPLAVAHGVLVPIPATCARRLPESRRFVRRSAADFVLELDSRFYLATGHYLIVDSAVRPVDVQRQLARHNRNAAPANGERASSHERGTTVDIARKAWNGHIDRMTRVQYHLLLMWLAYYQGTGRIHVIEERACIHIMVREDSNEHL